MDRTSFLTDDWRPRSDSNRRSVPRSSLSVPEIDSEIETRGLEPEFSAPTFESPYETRSAAIAHLVALAMSLCACGHGPAAHVGQGGCEGIGADGPCECQRRRVS